jgi:uncharacterized protein YjbI with pentapeptide repeats/beta-lactamase regulating signal transducer with metallopeptidase domain
MPPFQTIASVAMALSHALLDGIWLGALLALVLAVSLRAIKGLNAASRHAIWYGALIATAALPIIGFGWSVAHASASSAPLLPTVISQPKESGWVRAAGSVPTFLGDTVRPAGEAATNAGQSVHPADAASSPTLRLPFDTSAIILAIIAVVGVLSVAGLVGVLISLARLLSVKRESRPFEPAAEAALRRWSARPSGERAVSLRVSQGVDVPAAVGFLHPSILVPASWPANLEADELDKIVMHEYSHLRRADDWTAFVQRVAERLFWFNPAVRYMAARANLEREIACDDRVVAEFASATSYAECLWRIAQFSHMPAAKSLVPAALATRAQIVERIELLMNTERDVLPRIRPAAVLAIVPLAVALLVVGVVRAPAITLDAAPSQSIAHDRATPLTTSISGTSAKETTPAASTWVATGTTAAQSHRSNAAAPKTVALSGSSLDVRTLLQACTGCDLSGKDLRNADLHGLRLTGDDMSNADMRGANLRGTNFEGVDLNGARFDNADLTNAVFAGTNLKRVSWTGAKLDGIELQGVAIDAAMLHTGQTRMMLNSCQGCDMAGLDMRNLDLRGIHLQGADLTRADLRGANLAGAVLDGVDLDNALLDGTDLTNARLNGCNLTHVDLRHARIQGLKLEGADLRNMQFSGLNVRGLTAEGANLSGAQLRQVDLSGVRMNGSDFKSADLSGAQLVDGEFTGADFRNARLDGADFQRASLCGYNTYMDDHGVQIRRDKSCADLSGASTRGTDFRGVQICDWQNNVKSCREISSAELKRLSHSNLTGAVPPNF